MKRDERGSEGVSLEATVDEPRGLVDYSETGVCAHGVDSRRKGQIATLNDELPDGKQSVHRIKSGCDVT